MDRRPPKSHSRASARAPRQPANLKTSVIASLPRHCTRSQPHRGGPSTLAFMEKGNREVEYYRAVEDYFSALRGVPHLFSPKDFQLLRAWWRAGVPLSAVLAGIAEVFEKHAGREEDDPVVSLGYCRHAVNRHSKRIAEAHVGARSVPDDLPPRDIGARLATLSRTLEALASTERPRRPRIAEALSGTARRLARAAASSPDEDQADELLMALETQLLESLRHALPQEDAEDLERQARESARTSGATGEALERTRRAAFDRGLRALLALPRLELE